MKTTKMLLIVTMMIVLAQCFAQTSDLLKGVWGYKKGNNAVFEITAESIYYVDEMNSIKYSATVDSLIFIFENNYKYRTKYKVTTDSLILYKNNKVESRYVRFTE